MKVKQHPLYGIWDGMIRRCHRPFSKAEMDNYHGRGITVCERWRASVFLFALDMGPRPSPKHSIDRKDNDDGYWCGKCDECVAEERPANCRWATPIEQGQNKRGVVNLTHAGVTRCIAEWARARAIPEPTLQARINYGWPIAQALGFEPRPPPERDRHAQRAARYQAKRNAGLCGNLACPRPAVGSHCDECRAKNRAQRNAGRARRMLRRQQLVEVKL